MRLASAPLLGRSGHEAGRELLQKLYFEETGLPLPEILVTSRGKPYFPDSDLHFSITNTPRRAFCVLAQCPVGIDAEELDRTVNPRLYPKVLSPRELERVKAAQNPNRAFLALWVLKEAAAKLSGDGLRGFPNHTDYSPEDPRVQELDGCVLALMAQDPEKA